MTGTNIGSRNWVALREDLLQASTFEDRRTFDRLVHREQLGSLVERIDRFFDRFNDEPLATAPEYPLAMQVFHAVKDRPRYWNVIKATAHENFVDWLEFLPFRLLGAGRVSQGISLCDAWATVAASGQFKCLKAYLLAQTGRGARAKKLTAETLSNHHSEWKAFMWAAETFGVLGDVKRQERYCRKSLALTKTDEDREKALQQLLSFLHDQGRKAESEKLSRGHTWSEMAAGCLEFSDL